MELAPEVSASLRGCQLVRLPAVEVSRGRRWAAACRSCWSHAQHGLTQIVYVCICIGMSAIIEQLSQQLRRFEHVHRPAGMRSTGIPPLDGLLPEGGLHAGTLTEWLTDDAGGGATLAFKVAAQLRGESGVCVVIDDRGSLYPPAVGRLGVDLDSTIVVRPLRVQEALWAWEQSLRCPAVAVVIGGLGRLQSVEGRRLQLAAETGGGLGMLLRPVRELGQPSWADLRLLTQPAAEPPARKGARAGPAPQSRRLQVELVHCRSHFRTGSVLLDIDDETGAVHQVSRMVPAARAPRAAGA